MTNTSDTNTALLGAQQTERVPDSRSQGRPTLAHVIHIANLAPGDTPLTKPEIFRLRAGLAIASEVKRLGMSFAETQEALVGLMGDTLDLIMAGQQVRRECAIRVIESQG
jgi:hypothetical protein